MSGEDAVVIGGMGMVGQATRKSLDIPYYFDLKESNITLEEASKKLFIFLCLPTPTDEKGSQEKGVNLARDYIRQIKEYGGRNIFVIRSTVIPGTCRALSKEFEVMVCSNPELLSEDTWERDAINPRLVIIGADDIPSRNALVELWK
jgi:UDP-glucose 6-dehydrogenase